MCRNIKTLFNFEPPATEAEIRDAAVQFVRKLSGFNTPSKLNEAVFAAYGWPADLPEDDILAQLLELNLRRSAERGS